jgi:hypothetical protein
MGRHERFGLGCSLLQGASFVGLSFGVLTVNHLQGTWSSFCRNTVGQQSSPASRPGGVSDDQAQPPVLDEHRLYIIRLDSLFGESEESSLSPSNH